MHKLLYDGFIKVFKYADFYEIAKVTDSIAVLIYDTRTAQFVFVEQWRPSTKLSQHNANIDGMLLEVPAGRFDAKYTVKQLIVNEVKEETGITINEDDVELINDGEALAMSPGVLTEYMYLAYVEIDTKVNDIDESKFHGNKEEKEMTTRMFVPAQKALRKMCIKDMKTYALLQWFAANRASGYKI